MRILEQIQDLAKYNTNKIHKPNFLVRDKDRNYSIVALNRFESFLNGCLKIFGYDYFKLRNIKVVKDPSSEVKIAALKILRPKANLTENELIAACYEPDVFTPSSNKLVQVEKNAVKVKDKLQNSDSLGKDSIDIKGINKNQDLEAAVRYLVLTDQIKGYKIDNSGNYRIYKNEESLPEEEIIYTRAQIKDCFDRVQVCNDKSIKKALLTGDVTEDKKREGILLVIKQELWNRQLGKDPQVISIKNAKLQNENFLKILLDKKVIDAWGINYENDDEDIYYVKLRYDDKGESDIKIEWFKAQSKDNDIFIFKLLI